MIGVPKNRNTGYFLDINSHICHLFYHICPILSYILGKNVLYLSYILGKNVL